MAEMHISNYVQNQEINQQIQELANKEYILAYGKIYYSGQISFQKNIKSASRVMYGKINIALADHLKGKSFYVLCSPENDNYNTSDHSAYKVFAKVDNLNFTNGTFTLFVNGADRPKATFIVCER